MIIPVNFLEGENTRKKYPFLQWNHAIGCPIVSLECPRESQGDPRRLRSNSVQASLITMKITYKPDTSGLKIGGLIGSGEPGEILMHLEGSVISERVDP